MRVRLGIDMNIGTHALPAVLVFTLGLMPVASSADQHDAPAPARLKIILLKPSVRFDDARGFSPAIGTTQEETEYEQLLLDAAGMAAVSKAILLDLNKLEVPVVEVCRKLEPLESRLARGNINDEAVRALEGLAALDEQYAVLVQFLRLTTGPGRSWNSFTGAITSSTASTLIQAALVSGKTGTVMWKGERLIRNEVLSPTDAELGKALRLLYRDFNVK